MSLQISLSQHNSKVGAIAENLKLLQATYLNQVASNSNLDLVAFGEMALSGYTPLDEMYKQQYIEVVQQAINQLAQATTDSNTALIFGDTYFNNNKLYNAIYILQHGKIQQIITKQKLVDYDIFNETRYFTAPTHYHNVATINGHRIGLVVCEDLWHQDIVDNLPLNLEAIISINASPYFKDKIFSRFNVCWQAASQTNTPVFYVNNVSSIDGVVFDGQSLVVDIAKQNVYKLPLVVEGEASFKVISKTVSLLDSNLPVEVNSIEWWQTQSNKITNTFTLTDTQALEFYQVIQKGFLDYIIDNNLKGVILGVSGGIDSALALTIAADTLGAENILAVSMPSNYTSNLSRQIISQLVTKLQVNFLEIPIDSLYNQYSSTPILQDMVNQKDNIVGQNLQARIRSNILMTLSNYYSNHVVLSNGNKSELATGYFTLYGDSAGAFNLIKDLLKQEVFELARWRNKHLAPNSKIKQLEIIPECCINRAPSAELAPEQQDENDLLPYSELDAILLSLIEQNVSYSTLITQFKKESVDLVLKLIKSTEYKRKQSVIGIKLKSKGFGKEWQYPITNGFKL